MNKSKLFIWQGYDPKGKVQQGKLLAPHQKSASQRIKKQGISIYKIKPSKQQKPLKKSIDGWFNKLSILLNNQFELSDAIMHTINQCSDAKLYAWLEEVLQHLQHGNAFHQTLNLYPKLTKPFARKIIAAGEAGQQLDKALNQLLKHQQMLFDLKQSIKKAMAYPMVLLGSSIAICAVMIILIIPKFTSMYQNLGAKLPTLTQHIINISHFVQQHIGSGLLILILLSITGIVLHRKNPQYMFKTLCRVKFLQALITLYRSSTWSQTLLLALETGLSTTESIALANSTQVTSQENQRIKSCLANGQALSLSLQSSGFLSEEAINLLSTAEKSKSLKACLKQIYVLSQQQFQQKLTKLLKKIEPILLLLIATMIGALILGLYLPIFQLGQKL